jgi:GTP-binding protein
LNKADVPENRARFAGAARELRDAFLISAVTGEGIPPLIEHLWQLVKRVRQEEQESASIVAPKPEREYTYEAPFTVTRTGAGFHVEGAALLRAVRMTDFDNEYALRHFQDRLRRSGLFRALKRMGAREGDTIVIGDFQLEYRADD